MEIITLVENTSRHGRLTAEFGLSLHITAHGRQLLFDMGASGLFLRNAEVLGVDVAQVETAVVSHAHYDHGGGLVHFLAANDHATIFLKTGADGAYYGNIGAKMPLWLQGTVYPLVKRSALFSRYIGLEPTLFDTHADRLRLLTDDTQIEEGIFLVTRFTNAHPPAEGNKFLLEKTEAGLRPDRFAHELVLVIQESDGLAIFTGCGHSGILNMVKSVRSAFPGLPIKALVGGFHLAFQPGKPAIAGTIEEIAAIGRELMRAGIQKVYTGHCTGDDAYDILKSAMGDRLGRLYTGARISL